MKGVLRERERERGRELARQRGSEVRAGRVQNGKMKRMNEVRGESSEEAER